jgi:hypothetical protein
VTRQYVRLVDMSEAGRSGPIIAQVLRAKIDAHPTSMRG